jgi:hypothetical protein
MTEFSMLDQFKHDKSTVFSIAPFLVYQFMPGLYPGRFEIPACLDDSKPQRLLISASEHMMYVANQKRPTRIVTPSFIIAQAIVNDFLDGQLWTSPDSHPGICYLQGDVSLEKFLINNKDIFSEMRKSQKNWFVRICKETDNEWEKFHHHRVVSDQAKFAAKTLGLEPEWLSAEIKGFTFTKCPACGTANNSNNAVCMTCRCILNDEKFKALKFAS